MKDNPPASLRQRRGSDPAVSAWVGANAGSGKTHVLVDRVIRLMLAGAEPSRILCLTFTKAAAAEMAARVFNRLSGWVSLDDVELKHRLNGIGLQDPNTEIVLRARRLFARAQETPGGLKIQTIHAFCERLLQLFPVEAGVVPRFTVMDERAARETLEAARNSVLTEAISEPQSAAGRALATVTRHVQSDGFDDLVSELLKARGEFHDMLQSETGLKRCIAEIGAYLNLAPDESRDSINEQLGLNVSEYGKFAEALANGSASDQKRSEDIAGNLVRHGIILLDLRDFYLTQKDEPRKLSGIATKPVLNQHPWIEAFVESEQTRLLAALAKLSDLERMEATRALLGLAALIIGKYEERKRKLGLYDFDDLILRTNSLLTVRPDAAWILYKLDGGIDHVLLDEAQDTSPAQWQIVRALTEEFFAGQGRQSAANRTVFAVGDRKQSIYSFQGADPNVFELVHDDFKERIEASGQGFNDVDFTVSFRSTREVLEAIDTVFHESSPARRGLDGRIVSPLVHESNRPDDRGIVEIWPLVEPDEKDDDAPWTAPVDREPANSPRRKLARRIATTLKSWIGGRTIGTSDRLIQAGDILVLVRKRDSLFDALISELRKAGVPVAGADRLTLVENIAILDLLALAGFALLPDDDYALACVLKSPLMATPLSEDQLFAIAHGRGARPLWDSLQHSTEACCVTAKESLAAPMMLAGIVRPYEFFATILQESRKRIVARLGGEANDALDAFLQSALDFERGHCASLAAFVDWFVSGDVEIKRNMEQGAGEVRIMTVHGAKGLEAPIVILPDTTAVPDGRTQPQLLMIPSGNSGRKLPLWRVPKLFESPGITGLKQQAGDARDEEYRRLLYVAMSRARDELYICGYRGTNEPSDGCWYNLVSNALRPNMRPIADGEGWRLGVDPHYTAQSQAPAKVRIPLPHWCERAASPESKAPGRSSVTGVSRGDNAMTPEQKRSRERGIVIHRLLQVLPDTSPSERTALAQRVVARAGHREDLADAVLALLDHPAIAGLLASEGMSEVALSANLPQLGLTVSGRIDRLIIADDGILIVDYKTDRAPPERVEFTPPDYLRQMALYRAVMLEAYPGRPVRTALVWTSGPYVMEIPIGLLDRALPGNPAARP